MEGKMKKAIVMFVSFAFFLSAGCASREYVQQQLDPLAERISRLEERDCCEKAEAAARRAEEIARKCQQVCEKSFELQQQK
jgi:cell fate (sporulation/competence/biofilm development) regulator YmcA (YheA/YmcA/DUF963 family)